jgi:drug/metabolite transporter (DMT)-like permease
MSVPAAYLAIIVIWSTTPLAVKWSSDGAGFLFGVTSRMLLGTALTLIVLILLRVRIPLHKEALQTYALSSIGIFGAMFSVYWSAQFIPSGFISVMFALAPILTSIFSAIWLNERSLTPVKIIGVLVGIAGLAVMFESAINLGGDAIYGIAGILFAVLLFSLSGVGVKRLGADLHAIAANAGGLLIASFLYLLVWFIAGERWPEELPDRTLGSIVYLGVIGTTLGFALYMFLLQRLPVATLTLVTLITPATALVLGQTFNNEVVGAEVWVGAILITVGLGIHQWGHRLRLIPLGSGPPER